MGQRSGPAISSELRSARLIDYSSARTLGCCVVHRSTGAAAQLNRLIRRTGSQVLYIAGPGHGGPAIVANIYLEGTYSETYPQVSADEASLLALVRQFSTPGGIPRHVSV